MPVTKIMIIRHAEKPSDDGSIAGVSQTGFQDPEELIVRGWQRSGALIGLLVPPKKGSFASSFLATPDVIFASGAAKHSKSLRPQHTVLALADFLGQKLDLSHTKGEENLLVADVLSKNGNILIAWEHEAIPEIANRITGDKKTCPQKWPEERFDLAWIFDWSPAANRWVFEQVPQMLLRGDSSDLIPIS
ncbi:MAG: hypothetical protein ABI363_01200 [Nitrosospira sp.]